MIGAEQGDRVGRPVLASSDDEGWDARVVQRVLNAAHPKAYRGALAGGRRLKGELGESEGDCPLVTPERVVDEVERLKKVRRKSALRGMSAVPDVAMLNRTTADCLPWNLSTEPTATPRVTG